MLYQLSSALNNELQYGNDAGKMYGESLVIALATHIGLHYSFKHKKLFAPKGKLSAIQLKKVIDYANERIDESFGLEDLSKQTDQSIFHFAKLFKATVGISPHQYVLQLRLDKAKQYIKQKNCSFTKIAYMLGFSDQAHFSNAFKKANGVSPSRFAQG